MKKHFTSALTAGVLFAASLTATAQTLFPSPHPSATHTYSLKADWSSTNNPNGVWSYNQNTAPITTFQTFWWGQAGWGYYWFGDGCVMKGSAPAVGTNDPWGALITPPHDWRPNDVVLHAFSQPYGGETTFVNVTWTAPADGKIDISGRAWDAQIFSDRDVSWSLIVGGETIAQRTSTRGIFRKDKEAKFSANQLAKNSLNKIQVTQGEVVEFRVATTTYYGQFVGVEEEIRFKAKAK